METPAMRNFFISYNRADRAWAEWLAWQLEEAGYTTVLQAWDFRPGTNFVLEMQRAAVEAERTIAVLSPDYLAAQFTHPEWAAAFAQDPRSVQGVLLPVRVAECDLQGLLGPLVYIDLLGLTEAGATAALLAGVRHGRAKPATAPGFPGGTPRTGGEPPRFPGGWETRSTLEAAQPPRNPFFGDSPHLLGRDDEVQRIAEKLRAGNHCSIVGPPGSGKSFLVRTIQQDIPSWLGSQEHDVFLIPCRSIRNVRELQDHVVHHLGGHTAREWRSLFQRHPLRLLILDDLGGIDSGARGLEMRRWLRGLDDLYHTKLLMVSNERLDIVFQKDDPTRDSPLAGLDPLPVVLAPLSPVVCRQLVQQRLVGTTLDMAQFTDLLEAGPHQPRQLLERCAARYAALCRGN